MAKGPKGPKEVRKHAPAINDDRFARLQTDPRFLRPNREEAKVVVDDRFKGLLSGGLSGGRKSKIDKFGRKVKAKVASKDDDDMRRLYRLDDGRVGEPGGSGSSSPSEEEEGEKEKRFIDYARGEGQIESSDDEDSFDEDEDQSEEDGPSEVIMGNAAARRREKQSLRFEDDEEEEEEDDDDDFAGDELQVAEEDLSQLDAQAERTVQREAAAKKAIDSLPKRKGDTSRLAVVNMDWDHIRAIDLYKVFSSLVSPAGAVLAGSSRSGGTGASGPSSTRIMPVKGRVLNVRVYPSNFGLERMAKENREGPPTDIFKRDEEGRIKSKKKKKKKNKTAKKGDERDDDDSDESDVELFEVDEGGEFDEEALRNYQLERLRYYYAIVTFDSPQAARYIMDEVDGTEMERTANVFDLSFVPDDMTFPDKQADKEDLADEGWRDEATEVHDGGAYKGVDFTTDALRHSKVQLTWDADDPQRSKVTRQLAQQALTIDELRDEDFKAYLASDSEGSGEEEGEDDGRNKMRALLGLGGDDDEEGESAIPFGKSKSKAFEDGRKSRSEDKGREMQITFMPGLSEAAERKRSGVVVEAQEESTKDKYLRKQREKKERKRQQGRGEQEEEVPPLVEGNGKIGFDDPFFASDNDDDFDKALAAEQEGRSGKDKAAKKATSEVKKADADGSRRKTPAKEELLHEWSDAEGQGEGSDTGGHFSIKDILKAEQEVKGKKSRWAKKKEKKTKAKDQQREHQVQENFVIDVDDERFQGVFNDHRFALDPSHPSFIKTKSMDKLMDERRKRDKQQRYNKQPQKRSDGGAQSLNGRNELDDLVKSVKKRSAQGHEREPTKKHRM